MSSTTVLSPAALTMGQKVSLLTSVTWPTVAPAVSKLELTLKDPFLPETPMLLLLERLKLLELKQPLFDSESVAIGCLPLQGNDGDDLTDGGEREKCKAMEKRERKRKRESDWEKVQKWRRRK